MAGQSREYVIDSVQGADRDRRRDVVAVEEPLEIQVSSPGAAGAAAKSVSITMRTPGNDAELATGFLYTEGIIASADDIASVTPVGEPAIGTNLRNSIRVEVAAGVDLDLERLQRHFYTTSSCGVCGKASLDALRVNGAASLETNKFRIAPEHLAALPDAVMRMQPGFRATGGLHAAARPSTPPARSALVREDVGRHNATDKLIGALLAADGLPAQGRSESSYRAEQASN